MSVVTLGMGTDHLLGTTGVDGAVFGDVVVIAGGLEATRLVAGFEGFDGEVTVGSGGRAVDDD